VEVVLDDDDQKNHCIENTLGNVVTDGLGKQRQSDVVAFWFCLVIFDIGPALLVDDLWVLY